MLLEAARRLLGAAELLSCLCARMPIHPLFAAAVLSTVMASTYYVHRRRRRAIYLVDYACFRSIPSCRFPKVTFVEHARLTPSLHDSTIDFISRVIKRSGMGEETCYPPGLLRLPRSCTLDEAHAETELVVFSAIDDLLAKTCISPDAIDILITNCSVFCPVPSIADTVVNRYKLLQRLGQIDIFSILIFPFFLKVQVTRRDICPQPPRDGVQRICDRGGAREKHAAGHASGIARSGGINGNHWAHKLLYG